MRQCSRAEDRKQADMIASRGADSNCLSPLCVAETSLQSSAFHCVCSCFQIKGKVCGPAVTWKDLLYMEPAYHLEDKEVLQR